MGTAFGFCDLCINVEILDKTRCRKVLDKLYEIAINRTIEETVFETEKKNKKKTSDNEAPGVTVPSPPDITDLVSEYAGKLRILNRLTFVFGDPTRTHTLNQSSSLRKYDLYAVAPKTQAAFQFACSQLNTDIILVNRNCVGLKLSRKLYLQAAERGINFEIQYCDVISNANRKFAIHYSHLFHMFGKSKNIFISSGASMPTQIRSPYDIINLASILGLNETKAKASILSQSRYVILRAEGRRYGKAVFQIQTSSTERKEMESKMEIETEEADDEHGHTYTEAKKIKL
ncbi:ribonuclease P protein subunit p30 isoform X2 [Diprion similis]|uniref:ribonuclease P protein subunit p30 isoform X2 n=1 Tax=Diprion similis TaxID=362088 RepID=UPI001EF90ECD|nr:ribonuclease P protein subunit p30 isoform X2 [Diprion similis]